MSDTPPPSTGYTRLKQCRHGPMLYNIHDVYIGRSLDLYGEFSEGENEVFRQVLRPGDIAVEVGANIGAHTVSLAQHVGPGGCVIALEPQRLTFQILCANVALNNLTNVWAYRAAAGERAGHIKVPDLDPNAQNNFGGMALGKWEVGEDVPLKRIDDLGLSRCRLVKVDVEGMELEVLKGCTQVIAKFSPLLYVENDRTERSAALICYIDSLGYAMYWHQPPLFNANNFFKHAENVFGNIVSLNMLCVPKTAGGTIDGLRRVEVPSEAGPAPSGT